MKTLIFLIIASIAMASTIRYKHVYVSELMSLTDVVEATAKDGKKTYYYNNKRIDKRYEIVPCNKAERFCLVEKVEESVWQKQAIKHNCAYYAPTTGEFTWREKK